MTRDDLFAGEGETRALGRAIDWGATALGAVERWPAALRAVVRTSLESPSPTCLWCGPELVLIYNDAYGKMLRAKHPSAFGRRGRDVWAETWTTIAPALTRIRTGGRPFYIEDVPFALQRDLGRSGEGTDRSSGDANAWFTVSLSAVRDDEGAVVAILNLVFDSTRYVLARREAQRARSEAEEANHAKSQFLANMSHELRTPINAIIGYTDLLELGIAGPVTEGQVAHLARVRASSRHLLTLVNDILDLAKVEAGRLDVAQERVLAVNTIAAALALIGPQAARRGIRIEDACADDTTTVYMGDQDRVRQILANLLSNAVKFTPPGGTIQVACGVSSAPEGDLFEQGMLTYIRVTDTGVGIAPDELERIFRPFRQVEGGHTRTQGGTGLGLTISRRLARLMGGDVTVESRPGVGSTFTLWLPHETPPPLEEVILERTRETHPQHLAAAGEVLQGQVSAVLDRYKVRLRQDPLIAPLTAGVAEVDLEDHASSLLSDIAQSIVMLERSDAPPDRLQDGSEIQRVVADLHGWQRARLGWTTGAINREWEILMEETEAAIRRTLPQGDDADGVLTLLRRFLERATWISRRSLRYAQAAEGS